MTPPWSLRVAASAPLSLATMLRGTAWIVRDQGEPVRVGEGDIAVVAGDEPYTIGGDPTTVPRKVVGRDDYCRGTGEPGATCGEPDTGSPVLLSGAYERRGELGEKLLRALPPVLVVPGAGNHGGLLELVRAELASEKAGRRIVLDRVLDLLLVSVLREWFERPGAEPPLWYRAMADPVVGGALRLLHADPAHPWTVGGLAAETGLSRAAFARRFTAYAGTPPMTYLAELRIGMAADLLRSTGDTVASIAAKAGYADAFALSVAFSRLRGVSPSVYRDGDDGESRTG